MVRLIGSFSRLKRAKVLVVGDFMLDTYTTGRVERISPEAPVPILHVQNSQDLPGGAGNVVLNLKALGADVTAVGRIGADLQGERLKTLLEQEGIDSQGIFTQEGVNTPLKNRLIADAHHLIRIDQECVTPLDCELEKRVLSFIADQLHECEVVAISDYAKGFLTPSLLSQLISLATSYGIPTIVDPKGDDFAKYSGATLIKPNYKEAVVASKLSSNADLDAIGHELLEVGQCKMVIVTRSEKGITLFEKGQTRVDFPVRSKEVKDVTGAGDTVLAVTTLAVASGLSIKDSLELANIAAGVAIERLGCVRVSLSEIASRLLESNVVNKIFDESHLFALEQALQRKDLRILGINTKEGISTLLLTYIHKFSKSSDTERLMIYLIDSEPDEHFVSLLSSFREVDFIVVQSDSLVSLSERIHPSEVYTLEKGELLTIDHVHALIS